MVGIHRAALSSGALVLRGLAIVLVCAAVRLWLAPNLALVARDGTQYIEMARAWMQDPSGVVERYSYHVGYPAAVAAAKSLIGGAHDPAQWELAGQLVSGLANVLATLAVWRLGAMLFTENIGLLAALLLGVSRNWALNGADVLSDSPAICLELWALVLAVLAVEPLRQKRPVALLWACAVGVLSGAAYLVRVEGLVAVVVAAGLWLLHVKKRSSRALTLGAVGAALATAAACAAPYVLAIGTLTKKKRVGDFVPTWSVQASVDPDAHYWALREFANKFTEAFSPVLLALLVLWIAAWVGMRMLRLRLHDRETIYPRRPGRFAVGAVWLLLAPVVLAQYSISHVMSHRYLLLLACVTAPLAGAAIYILRDLVKLSVGRWWPRSAVVAVPVAGALAAILLLAITLRPARADKLPLRYAGEYIHQSTAPDRTLLADDPWILYYARLNGQAFDLDAMREGDLLACLLRTGADLLAVSDAKPPPQVRSVLSLDALVRRNAGQRASPVQVFDVDRSMLPSAGGYIGGFKHMLQQVRQGAVAREELLARALTSRQCREQMRPVITAMVLRMGLSGQAPAEALEQARLDVLRDRRRQWVDRALGAPAVRQAAARRPRELLAALYEGLLFRQHGGNELELWEQSFAGSTPTPRQLAEAMLAGDEFQDQVVPLATMHMALTGAPPDANVMRRLVAGARTGATLESCIAQTLGDAAQPRWRAAMQDTDPEPFVRMVYDACGIK
jgi:4-amino-4-deoxy-L-arabinose transferase-like glycosyltransferase